MPPQQGNDETAVEIRGLTRTFRTKVALNDVSLSVPKGCVFGLVGENGAGKTTLIKHMMGLLKPQSGSVKIFGHNPVTDPEHALSHIGYLSEDRDIPGWMRINELMRYTQGFYPNWDEDFAEDLLERFDLNPTQKIKTLSMGQTAKTGLLIALAHRPDLLVLDEPSSGLDPVVREHIVNAAIRTVADEGRTVVFSSHLLDEVEAVSDYVAMINSGNIIECDRLQAVTQSYLRVTIEFGSPVTAPPAINGALTYEGEGKRWTILCNGKAVDIKAQIEALDARVVGEEHPTLHDIFVAHVGAGSSTR